MALMQFGAIYFKISINLNKPVIGFSLGLSLK